MSKFRLYNLLWMLLPLAALGVFGSRQNCERQQMIRDIDEGSIFAWSRHITGQDVNDLTSFDKFESIAVIPGRSTRANGDMRLDDELWAVVNRTIDGNSYRFVEQFQPLDWGTDPNYCWFVDCGPNGDSGGGTDLTRGTGFVSSYPTLRELTAGEIPGAPSIPSDTALSSPISVTDATGLQAMTPGNHYSIDGDIDLDGVSWTPLTFNSTSEIVIEGNNHTISNLSISGFASSRGLIGQIQYNTGGGQIRNLHFQDCSVEGVDHVAIFCGYMYPNAEDWLFKNITFTNCTVSHYTGGVASYDGLGVMFGSLTGDKTWLYGCTATSCTVESKRSAGRYIGGLIGPFSKSTPSYIIDSNVVGGTMTLEGESHVGCGGFIGYSMVSGAKHELYDCSSSMAVSWTATANSATASGIAGFYGHDAGVDVTSSSSTGNLSLSTGGYGSVVAQNVGGFIGASTCNEIYTNCYTTGSITFSGASQWGTVKNTGGYGGYLDYDINALRCYSTRSITVQNNVDTVYAIGGFIGRIDTAYLSSYYRRSWSEGDISFQGNITQGYEGDDGDNQGHGYGFIGAFIGYINYDDSIMADVENCYTWSSITLSGSYPSNLTVGGLIGGWGSDIADMNFTNCYCAQTDTRWGSGYTGQLPGDVDVHGFGGGGDADNILVTAVYYDQETSSLTTSAIGVKHTTAWLQTQSNFEAAGWDFNDIWYIATQGGGADANEWAGADHAGGLVECVYADGRPIGTFTVDANGALDLDDEYDVVIAGLNYFSILETEPLHKQTTLGRWGRIQDVTIDFYESMGAHVGANMDYSADWLFSEDDFATPIEPYTGYKGPAPFLRGISRDPEVYIWVWKPIPMTIRSVSSDMEVTIQ